MKIQRHTRICKAPAIERVQEDNNDLQQIKSKNEKAQNDIISLQEVLKHWHSIYDLSICSTVHKRALGKC